MLWWGCDQYEGYVSQEADVLLLNTCSIREKAQEKVFHVLGRWKLLKRKNPDLIIGVGGCVASQEGKLIRQRAPYVDIVFGPQTLHRVQYLLQPSMMETKAVGPSARGSGRRSNFSISGKLTSTTGLRLRAAGRAGCARSEPAGPER